MLNDVGKFVCCRKCTQFIFDRIILFVNKSGMPIGYTITELVKVRGGRVTDFTTI